MLALAMLALITLRSSPLLSASVQVYGPVRFLGASPLGAPSANDLWIDNFAFLSLAVRVDSGARPSALPRCVATWRANDLWIDNTAFTPPHRPIEFFAYNYFDCCRRGSP
jgi:hypothetical protein